MYVSLIVDRKYIITECNVNNNVVKFIVMFMSVNVI